MPKLLDRSQYTLDKFPISGFLKEKIIFLLGFAVMAPSTNNAQPWLFKIKENSCELYLNRELSLPYTDPLGRCTYISLGCSLENLIIAAKYFGVFKDLKYFEDEGSGKVAEVFFADVQSPFGNKFQNLIENISKRADSRGKFEKTKLHDSQRAELNALNDFDDLGLNIEIDPEKIERLAFLTSSGLKEAHAKKVFRGELSGWIINSVSKRPDGIPGYSMRVPLLLSLLLPKIIKFFNTGPILGKLNYESIIFSSAGVVISAHSSNPLVWLKVGRLAERIMLNACGMGLKSSIYVASIEIGEYAKKVQRVIGSEAMPQFFFCIGKMNRESKLTQRWHPRHKIIV